MRYRVLVVAAILAAASAHAADLLSARDVLSLVAAKGADGAVQSIWGSQTQTQQLLTGVASADARWLEVAFALAPGADADASESLDEALAVALLAKPYAVLPRLRRHWWQHGTPVCVFAEDGELPGGVRNYIDRLKTALSKTPPPGLIALRKQCLDGLEQTRKTLFGTARPAHAGARSGTDLKCDYSRTAGAASHPE